MLLHTEVLLGLLEEYEAAAGEVRGQRRDGGS
jgi:hypothetical protein